MRLASIEDFKLNIVNDTDAAVQMILSEQGLTFTLNRKIKADNFLLKSSGFFKRDVRVTYNANVELGFTVSNNMSRPTVSCVIRDSHFSSNIDAKVQTDINNHAILIINKTLADEALIKLIENLGKRHL